MSQRSTPTKRNSQNLPIGGANEVRIIAGQWRRRRLSFPSALGLRPTGDRIRETLFNWLGQDLTGQTCLDLFAGSGALGLEALSRGARKVVLVERNSAVAHALQQNIQTLLGGVTPSPVIELRKQDAINFLQANQQKFDFVFVDPPFADNLWPAVLSMLPQHLNPNALVYIEAPKNTPVPEGWTIYKEGKTGQVTYRLLECNPMCP